MGLLMSKIFLRNARMPALALEVDALADSATLHVCIPQHICDRLKLEPLGEREVLLADGSKQVVPYVGPLEIRFKNRAGFVGALVMGNQVLVGAIAMEDMDLVILPFTRELEINPRNPKLARTIATTVPGASEPPGRYVLPPASPGRRSSSSAGWPSARSPSRSRASPPL
jgi:clan AA aspartic protease